MIELIAEVGSNHNGDLDTAKELVCAAAAAGADTVKFQHYPDERYGPHPMPAHWLRYLGVVAESEHVGFLCSVFDERTLTEYVRECRPSRVKIASPELTHHRLLAAARDAGLQIILSTGMSTEEEVYEAIRVCDKGKPDDALYTLVLQCVSSYPSPPEEMNLRVIAEGEWNGLSDHTLDPVVAPVAATAMCFSNLLPPHRREFLIEKHFTLDKTQDGPDHSYAVDPDGFRRMVDAVRMTESMLGDGLKRVMPSEDPLDRRTAEWRAA